LAEAFGGNDLVFLQKINFYPPCPQPELTLGLAPHTDLSTLTILVPNEVQGLQIFGDGQWYDAQVRAGRAYRPHRRPDRGTVIRPFSLSR
jgi:flavonol synthase